MAMPYTVDMTEYISDEQVESNCNSITFVNTGNVLVKIKGFPLNTNQSLSIDGNYGEFDTTVYDVVFVDPGPGCSLQVVRKVYQTNPGATFEKQGGGNAAFQQVKSIGRVGSNSWDPHAQTKR